MQKSGRTGFKMQRRHLYRVSIERKCTTSSSQMCHQIRMHIFFHCLHFRSNTRAAVRVCELGGHLRAATKTLLTHTHYTKLLSLSRGARTCWAICSPFTKRQNCHVRLQLNAIDAYHKNILTRSSTTWASKNNKSIACFLLPRARASDLCGQKNHFLLKMHLILVWKTNGRTYKLPPLLFNIPRRLLRKGKIKENGALTYILV